MGYRTEIDAKFTFTDGQNYLTVGDVTFDLSKVDTLDEWRAMLLAIASPMLRTTAPVEKKPEPTTTGVASDIQDMSDTLRAQAEQARQQVSDEFRQLKDTYAATIDAVRGQPGGQPAATS